LLHDSFFELLSLEKRRVKIKLNNSDLQKAVKIAQARSEKEKIFKDTNYGKKLTSIQSHLLGVLSELATSRYCQAHLDYRIFFDCGDDGIDVSNDWFSLGVKCTTHVAEPYLRIEQDQLNEKLDGFVLCSIDLRKVNEVNLVGWANVEMVKKANKKQFVHFGPINYVLYEHELLDMDLIRNIRKD